MAIFGIGDLHLSTASKKPMDVFEGWSNYTERLKTNWNKRVGDDDLVVIPGDLSWAMKIEDAKEDFKFIHELNGKKLVFKGNHDFWWSTVTKIESFLLDNEFSSISVLHNKSIKHDEISVAGTRSWLVDRESEENMKIYFREVNRLRLSLEDALKNNSKEIIVFLHYPPIYSNYIQPEIIELLNEFKVKRCFYGHIHGNSIKYAINGEIDGVFYKLISADYLQFSPYLIES